MQEVKSEVKIDSEKILNFTNKNFPENSQNNKNLTNSQLAEFEQFGLDHNRLIPLKEDRDANDKMIQKSVNDLEIKKLKILQDIEDQINKGSKGNIKIQSKKVSVQKVIKTSERLQDNIKEEGNGHLTLFGTEFERESIPTKNRKPAILSSNRSSKRNSSNSRRGSNNSQSNKRVKRVKKKESSGDKMTFFDFGVTASKRIKEQPENE